jgi:hypothetical protein
MDIIRCPRCAKEIPDVSRFCRRCGCALAWRSMAMPAVIPPVPGSGGRTRTLTQAKPARPEPKAGGVGAGTLIIFTVVAAGFLVRHHAVVRPIALPSEPDIQYMSPPYITPAPVQRPMRNSAGSSVVKPQRYPVPQLPTPLGPRVIQPPPAPQPWNWDRYPHDPNQDPARTPQPNR